MKSKTLCLMIMRFDMIGAPHWYVTSDASNHCRTHKKFIEYKDALAYAKKRAYVRNITTYER